MSRVDLMISRLLNIPYDEILEMRSDRYFHCVAAVEAAMNEMSEDEFDVIQLIDQISGEGEQSGESMTKEERKKELRERHRERHEELLDHSDIPDTPASRRTRDSLLGNR